MPDMKVRFLASIGGNDDFTADLLVDKVLKLDDSNKVIGSQSMQLADVVLEFAAGTQFPEPGKPSDDVSAKVRLTDALSLPLDPEKLVLKLSAKRAVDGVCTLEPTAVKLGIDEKVWDPLLIKSCEALLTFGGKPWQLELKPKDDGNTVAEMLLLGCLFEFSAIKLNASGIVYASAKAKPTANKPELGGLDNVTLIQGSVELSGARRQASLQFSFSLAYFAGSKGLLDIHMSRQEKTKPDDPEAKWLVATSTSMNSDATWSDPSGWLSFSKMGLSFDLSEEGGKFTVKQPRASGTVTFRAGALVGAAKEWLGELFSGLRTDFRDVSLSGLGGKNFSFAFNPAGGFQIRALGIMQLKVASLSMGVDSFSLRGISLELENLAGAVVRGGVGDLKVSLRGAPTLDMQFTSIDVAMSAPSGIKASGSLQYIETDVLQAMEGSGSLTTPTFPGITIKFRVGRARLTDDSGWIPTVVVYAAVPVVIQLFPGVVIRQVALGLGINAEISGTTRLTLTKARQRLAEGLPDASSLAAWKASNTPLVLVARAFAASTQGPDTKQMELYVCDLTLIVTSDFQLAVLGKLWLQTSMDDAQTPAFQALPGAVAMMLLDGQEPSLRVVAQTNANGLTSMSKCGLVGKMLGSGLPETHLAMEATPNGMALVVGPNPISGDLGPLQISGSSLLALRSTPTKSYALLRSSLQAAFGASASMSFGLVSISASMRFGFSSELVLLGFYENNSLVVYGRSHVAAFVAVALHIRTGFEIRISLPFGGRITISWAKDWDFELRVHVDLEIELALVSDGGVGIRGHAAISVNLCGISASLRVPVDVNGEKVDLGRTKQTGIENDLKLLLG